MHFYFDANRYKSVFSRKAIKKPELADEWLATWQDKDSNIHHDLLYQAKTNNEAEYGSMLMVLHHLLDSAENGFKCDEAIVHGDSQLVIYQMIGKYKVKVEDLRPLWLEAINLVHVLNFMHHIPVTFQWIPRGTNNIALGLIGKIKTPDPSLDVKIKP